MNKEIRAEVQRLSGLDKSTCSLLLSGLERVFQEEVIHMTALSLDGLGLFVPHKHPEYLQDDPASGQVLLYPPRITCRFQPQGEAATGVSVAPPASGRARIERTQLSTLLADYVKLTPEQADAFLRALIQSTIEHLHAGEEVTWTNFGTFRIVNFRDGASSRIAWVIDEKMREQINAPFSCFEPVPVGQMEVKPAAPAEAPTETPIVAPAEAPAEVLVEPPVEEPVEAPAEESAEDAIEPPVETPAENPDVVAAEAPQDEADDAPAVIPAEEPAPAAPESAQETLNAPAQIVQNRHKTLRKWIFAGIIFLFLIIICNICASLLPSSRTESASEPPHKVEADRVEDEKAEPAAEPSAEAEEVAPENSESEAAEQESDTPAEPTVTAPAEVATDSESAAAAQTLPAQPSAQMYQLGPDGQRLKERVQPGDRLTLMARRLYGHKAFWVYIYEVNKDRLKSPNNVAVGMDLYLPDPAYWQIDADNEASVQTALRRASKLVD